MRDPDVEANARLTGYVAMVLVVLLAAEFVTGLRSKQRSGIELWLFGYRFGFIWVPLHHASSYVWFVTMAVHVFNYLRRAPQLAIADWRDHMGGAFTRRSMVVGSLVLGAVLAIAMLPFPTPFLPAAGGS